MKIVFDVTVDGKVQETIHPQSLRLTEIHSYIKAESYGLIKKYGSNVCINRRVIYS